jgi:hypothetical protein
VATKSNKATTKLLKTEYFLAFEGSGRFEIQVPSHVQRVTSFCAVASGKVDPLERVRFFDRTGTEFFAMPVGMVLLHGLVPFASVNPDYTYPQFFGFCVAPEGVVVRGWGRRVSIAKRPESEEKEKSDTEAEGK